MTVPGDETWLDGDAGRLVRPYTVSNGRTSPSKKLDLLSMVVATGNVSRGSLEPDHVQILSLCHQPASVAEIAARLRLPAVVTKVLLSDLVDCGAVTAGSPRHAAHAPDRFLLEEVLDALQRRL
ncbi:MAG TPA: DUF742 domain-containing protein [Streptosporangiaceae bacterium]|nr:DUF742 domain-containing protein [Streptosporangiaceae bacterium]